MPLAALEGGICLWRGEVHNREKMNVIISLFGVLCKGFLTTKGPQIGRQAQRVSEYCTFFRKARPFIRNEHAKGG